MIWREFYSRRNKVSLVRHNGDATVRKQFSNEEDYEREKGIYLQLEGSDIPRPRVLEEYAKNGMYLEYIDAPTLCELLEYAEEGTVDEKTVCAAYCLMVDWLTAFHEVTEKGMGDTNARNFLFDGLVLYGLDFENTTQDSSIEDDIGQALAYLMAYEPTDSQLKQRLFESITHYAIEQKQLSESSIQPAYVRERKILTDRRNNMRR